MPVEIKMKAHPDTTNDLLFDLLLPPVEMEGYNTLKAAGVNFKVNFYAVIADLSKFGLQNESVVLPVSTTGLLKGSVDDAAKKVASDCLIALVKAVFKKLSESALQKVADTSPFSTKGEGKVEKGTPPLQSIAKPEPTKPSPPKPIPTKPIKLAEATILCQPVKGTSDGSVYYVVAISPSVKMAARIKKNGTISFRIEGKPSKEEVNLIQMSGMTPSGSSHWSIHFDPLSVPVARCVGAFIMGLGINFTEQITSINQIKISAGD